MDGLFAVEDKYRFPEDVFKEEIRVPVALLMSDEWQMCNKPITDYTNLLMEKSKAHGSKLITIKQTKHYNFVEFMYWVPQPLVTLLRLSGIIHRRGDPRKTYRRTTKWLAALIQQYTQGNPVAVDSSL